MRERRGLVLELSCGSGALTRHLTEAGHRVVATDASPAMLELARRHAPDAEEIRQVVLPDDPLPDCDAVVSVGHVLSYLPDESAIERALVAAASALRPGGVFALDLCDLRYGEFREGDPAQSRVEDSWALVTRFWRPQPNLFVREMTTFVRADDGSWHREDERHVNVLVDTAAVPGLLSGQDLEVRVAESFGTEILPPGLVALVGTRSR